MHPKTIQRLASPQLENPKASQNSHYESRGRWLWNYVDRECVGTREIGVAKSIDGPTNDCRAEVAIGVVVVVHRAPTI